MSEPTFTNPHSQLATVQSLDATAAVLVLVDGQVLRWPVALLPKTVAVGNQVRLIVHDGKTEVTERQAMAQALLNEIFSPKH